MAVKIQYNESERVMLTLYNEKVDMRVGDYYAFIQKLKDHVV